MAAKKKMGSNNRWVLCPDDVMIEILQRLPLKSLCICRSVCKSWMSIIYHPEFLNIYGNRWRRWSLLLSIREVRHCSYPPKLKYLLNDDDEFEEWPLTRPPRFFMHSLTQVINGLVCIYFSFRVTLFNLSTGESLTLPFSRYNTGSGQFRFFLGFDPISRAYKVLKVDVRECQILTLEQDMREDSWKEVPGDAPLGFNPKEAVCIAGTLYWIERGEVIIAFDLNSHKFYTLPPPPIDYSTTNFCDAALQFNGCLAFSYKTSDRHFSILSLRDNCGWSRQTFELPTELSKPFKNLTPVGNLTTGEIMLVDAEASNSLKPIYSYDPDSQKFEMFVVCKFPPFKSQSDSLCLSGFEANVYPLSLILKTI